MAKKIEGYIKLNIPAGAANPSPPVGPALGQRGVNIMEFCKAFNASTDTFEKNMPIPVVITVFSDKSFSFITKTPPVSYFLNELVGFLLCHVDLVYQQQFVYQIDPDVIKQDLRRLVYLLLPLI